MLKLLWHKEGKMHSLLRVRKTRDYMPRVPWKGRLLHHGSNVGLADTKS